VFRPFHERVVGLAGNATLAQYSMLVHYLINGHVRRAEHTRSTGPTSTVGAPTDAHSTLIELIEAGALHAATTHWQEHLESINDRWSRQFDLQSRLEQQS